VNLTGGRRRRAGAALAAGLMVAVVAFGTGTSSATSPGQSRDSARLDDANLRLAANAVQAQALASGALPAPVADSRPAVVLLLADEALIDAARDADPGLVPMDTRSIMGPVPYVLAHPLLHRPHHRPVNGSRALALFTAPARVGGSAGLGLQAWHGGASVAPFRVPDGVYVDPALPSLAHPTIGEVALRSALKQLGQPYVWGGAGPATFDCSGLVRWAYGHAGVVLTHYSGDQWNEAARIPAADALPGDLVVFGNPVFHIGIYLGAGWMLNAPGTGHYVDVAPVLPHPAGLVRP
jgi:NlpC/P60 family